MDPIQKRDILAGWLKATADAVKSGIVVETRFREVTLGISSPGILREVMGRPIYYADCLIRGQTDPGFQDRDARAVHTYDVRLWYEYEDASSYTQSSQKVFDELTYGSGGIITKLLDERAVSTSDGRANMPLDQVEVGLGDEVAIDMVHEGERILAHLLTFTIRLE